jgi:hypothetical protein
VPIPLHSISLTLCVFVPQPPRRRRHGPTKVPFFGTRGFSPLACAARR